MTKKGFLLICIASFFWLSILALVGSGHATLFSKWTDNISNISASWIFLSKGPKIYGHPAADFTAGPAQKSDFETKWTLDLPDDVFFKDLKNNEQPNYLAWPHASRPYPPGAMILFSPFAVMAYQWNLGFQIPAYLLAFCFLIIAHLGFVRLKDLILSQYPESDFKFRYGLWILFLFLYLEMVHWALQGQFQICMVWPLAECLIRLKDKRFIPAFLWFSIAFFIHLHSIIYLPMLALAGFSFFLLERKDHSISFNKTDHIQIGLSFIMCALASYCLIRNLVPYSSGQLSNANPWFWKNWYLLSTNQIVPFLTATLILTFIYIKSRSFIPLIIFFSASFIFLISSNLCAWYSLALLPIFGMSFFSSRTKLALLGHAILYVLITGTFLSNSPFEFYFIRAYWNAPLG